jgi:hypothetical protein
VFSLSDGYGNLSTGRKLSGMVLMVRKCIWATARFPRTPQDFGITRKCVSAERSERD